jgi:uncharacterized protein (TIGR03437 family)
MRRVHYSIKFLVCFTLTWVSLTLAAARLERAATCLPTVKAAASVPLQAQPQGSWIPTGGPLGGTVNSLIAFPDGGVMAGTGGGVYYTMDNGENWQARNTGLTNLNINALLLVGAVVYAGTLGGVFRSDNRGITWTPLNLGLTVLAVLALRYIGSTLFAGTNGGGLFVFNGQSWAARNTGLSNLRVNDIIAVGAFIFLATVGGIFRSDNSGSSWLPINTGLTVLGVIALTFIGTTLFAGTDGGVFRSTNNGGSWLPVNVGLTNLVIRSLFVVGAIIFVGTQGGLFRSNNEGGSWTPLGLAGLTALAVRAILIIGTLYLIGTFGGGVFRSNDQGQNWMAKNRGLAAAEVRDLNVVRRQNCAGFAAQSCDQLHAGGLSGYFVYQNLVWAEFTGGFRTPGAFQVNAIHSDGTNLYCGNNDGAYRKPIDGTLWVKIEGVGDAPLFFVSPPSPPPGFIIPDIYAGTQRGVLFSRNGGSFSPDNSGFPNPLPPVPGITVTADGKPFSVTDGSGVFEKVGATWQPRNGNLTDLRLSAVGTVTAADGEHLLVGNLEGEIFRHKLPVPTSALWERLRERSVLAPQRRILVFVTPRIISSQLDSLSSLDAGSLAPELQTQASPFILAGTLGDGALISTDQGKTWQAFNNGLGNLNVFDFAVNNGQLFAATGGGVYVFAPAVTSVSAASFSGAQLAAESIAAAFGTGLATGTASATGVPLPTTLAGTRVLIKDSAGVERAAPLFFAAPGQINFQLPPGTANGAAIVTVTNGNGSVSLGTTEIAQVAPGLFAANANGQGVAVAVALRVRGDGSQSFEPVARFDAMLNRFVSVPIELGAESDRVFLILFATGLRFRSALTAVSARLGGADAEVSFAGAQGDLIGLDQVNLRLPRSLAGRGEIDVALSVDGKTANTLRINVR